MPRPSRSKPAPDVDALVAASLAALERDKAVARSALGPPPVRERVLASLRGHGYEVTPKVVRVPLKDQLAAALEGGVYIAMKALGSHVRGGSAAEARKAALSLSEQGRARRAMRTDAETLVPTSADLLGDQELSIAAERVTDLAKRLQKTLKMGKGVGVLRSDIQEAISAILTTRPRSAPRGPDWSPELTRVLVAVERVRDATTGLSFVPEVAALLAPALELTTTKRALLEAASRGLLELRPEGGLGRLSDAEKQACPEGPQGTRLSWARRIEVHS